jgi:hypothetical protein
VQLPSGHLGGLFVSSCPARGKQRAYRLAGAETYRLGTTGEADRLHQLGELLRLHRQPKPQRRRKSKTHVGVPKVTLAEQTTADDVTEKTVRLDITLAGAGQAAELVELVELVELLELLEVGHLAGAASAAESAEAVEEVAGLDALEYLVDSLPC